MPITTIYSSSSASKTTLAILKEFLNDYMSEIDIMLEKPDLDNEQDLERPILYLELFDGADRNTGMGNAINQTQKGQFHTFDIMAWWIITSTTGGQLKVRDLYDKMQFALKQHGDILGAAGLKRIRSSSLRDFPKAGSNLFYGGRNLITLDTMISW